MKRSTKTSQHALAAVAALVSGGLYFFSTGLEGIRPLVWIAPIPVLLISLRLTRSTAFIVAFGAYVLGGLNFLPYMSRLAPTGIVLAQLLIPSAAFALVSIAFRDAIVQFRHRLSFLAFPIGWTAYEFLLSIASPHGTAGSIAYTQSAFLPVIQIASLTGLSGITFIVTLVPAGVAAAIHHRDRRLRLTAIMITVIVAVGSVGYGWIRLSTPVAGNGIRVGAVAMDSTVRSFNTTDRTEALNVVNAYARLVSQAADRGASIVVLPEKFVGVTSEYEADILSILQKTAAAHKIFVVAGLNRVGTEPYRNMAVLIAPDGSVAGEYDKTFLIPGYESDYTRGEKTFLFNALGFSSGIAICKDLDFPRWIRQYGQAGTGVLFVPAWDFRTDAWLHSRMAILRGVENGFAVVRSANEGVLTITDDRGRIISEAPSTGPSGAVIFADVLPGSGRTMYGICGEWFPVSVLCVLLFLLVISARRIFGRRFTKTSTTLDTG
jgi:apolipoprotein N-acyltransferase